MNSAEEKASALRRQIADAETQLASLKLQLLSIEGKDDNSKDPEVTEEESLVTHDESKWPMSLEEYKRYGRQMIVSDIGIQG